ncbi:MAG: CbtB-domain containing protein [Humibacillus sp.]
MTTAPPSPTALPRAVTPSGAVSVPAWAWVLLAFAVVALYVMTQESGAVVGAQAGQLLHELTHDARHALGVPCH